MTKELMERAAANGWCEEKYKNPETMGRSYCDGFGDGVKWFLGELMKLPLDELVEGISDFYKQMYNVDEKAVRTKNTARYTEARGHVSEMVANCAELTGKDETEVWNMVYNMLYPLYKIYKAAKTGEKVDE